MQYQYLSNGFYQSSDGQVFRLDQRIRCDPKSGTVPCGNVCRLPANCKKTKGFGQGADRAAIQQAEDRKLPNRLKAMGRAALERATDRHFQEHLATHVAENVGAWGVGRIGGGALAKVAEAHGIDPEVARVGGEAIVQALAGTAIKAIVEKERDPKKLAVAMAAELGAAIAGKVAHHEVEHMVHEGSARLAKLAGPLLAGKGAGIGVNQAIGYAGRKLFRLDSLGALSEQDLETLWLLAILGLSVRSGPILG